MDTFGATKEEFLEAIRKGCEAAIWKIATNATSMPCADFYDSIQDGVRKGIEQLSINFNEAQ